MKHFPLKPTCNNRTGNQIRWSNFQAQNQRTDSCQKKQKHLQWVCPLRFSLSLSSLFRSKSSWPLSSRPLSGWFCDALDVLKCLPGAANKWRDKWTAKVQAGYTYITTIKHEQNLTQSTHVKNGKTFVEFFFSFKLLCDLQNGSRFTYHEHVK